MKDETKENVKIIKDWVKQYYEKPEKVTSFMLDQEDRIKELEQINKEHRKINGELREENNYYFKKNNEISALNTSLRADRDNYKARIDKAIEYIGKNKYVDDYGKWTIDDDNDYLLNILQNGEENE